MSIPAIATEGEVIKHILTLVNGYPSNDSRWAQARCSCGVVFHADGFDCCGEVARLWVNHYQQKLHPPTPMRGFGRESEEKFDAWWEEHVTALAVGPETKRYARGAWLAAYKFAHSAHEGERSESIIRTETLNEVAKLIDDFRDSFFTWSQAADFKANVMRLAHLADAGKK